MNKVSQQTSDQILRVARALVRRNALFSMDQLALTSGVSRATLYRHFASRAEVIAGLGLRQPVPANRHDQLIVLATRQLKVGGLRKVTLGGLARAARVSLVTVRRHFASRAALLEAIAEKFGAREHARALALSAMERPLAEGLLLFAKRALAAFQAAGPLLRSLIGTADGPGPASKRGQRAHASHTISALTIFFTAHKRRGALVAGSNPQALAEVFTLQLLTAGMLHEWFSQARRRSASAWARELTRTFLHGVAA